MARLSRDKGAAFEREIARRLSAVFGYRIDRILGQARDSGHDITAGPLLIECKRRKSLGTLMKWYRQAEDAREGTHPSQVPVVVMREDNGPPMALLSLDDLLTLYTRSL